MAFIVVSQDREGKDIEAEILAFSYNPTTGYWMVISIGEKGELYSTSVREDTKIRK